MRKNYFLFGMGMALLVIITVVFVYKVITKLEDNQKVVNYTGVIDEGFDLPDPSPISEKECTANAQLVIKKFNPDALYRCDEEEVKFGNRKIPYIQINYVMVRKQPQEFNAIIVDNKIELVTLKPHFFTSYYYDYNSSDEIKSLYGCDIDIDEWDKDNKITFEIVLYENEYRWRINYNQVVGKNSKDKSCVINGYEIKPTRYTEKSMFNLTVKN